MAAQQTMPVAGRGSSIAWRAILAIVLMIGFYILALGMIAALLGFCYFMVFESNRIPIKLIVVCLCSAGIIAWSLLPRFDRFTPPGPRLLPERHPRLFAEIASIAKATGQEMPVEVYLEADVNAWVAQRGGIMGFGSRRVMGLGLALMRVLDVSEFRAVLAHEFGHYHGGDTKLGPWVYKTRGAIGRTIVGLGDSLVQKPFLLYGKMFLRITHAVSRWQEYTADRLAANIVGAGPLSSGLGKIHRAGIAFTPYWQNELVPVLAAGYRPPLAEGFVEFLGSATIATAVEDALGRQLKDQKGNAYDTHPPLPERIKAVADLPQDTSGRNKLSAITLLSDLSTLERELLVGLAGQSLAAKLQDLRWEDAGTSVYIPMWQEAVQKEQAQLAGLIPEDLWDRFSTTETRSHVLREKQEKLMVAAGAALTLLALRKGAKLECKLGMPVAVENQGVRMEPFSLIKELSQITAAQWQENCEKLGISGIALTDAAN